MSGARSATLLTGLLLFGAAILGGCKPGEAQPASKTDLVLDTSCTITLYDKAPPGTLDKAFALVHHIDATMTVYGSGSEATAINQAAGDHPVRVSSETFSVIRSALTYSALSSGAFDITVGPLVKLWGIGTAGAHVPSLPEIEQAISLVDYRDVVLDAAKGTVFLKRKGMAIDLGGIAKGFAAQKTVEFLASQGVKRAIIDFGGNIVAMGSKGSGKPWRIGIQDPDKARGSYIALVEVSNEAVVTSGKYERYFIQDGVRYHHIMDPRTGFPVNNGIASTTIVTGDSTIADALNKVVFVPGLQKGLALIDSLSGQAEAIVVMEDKTIYITRGLESTFHITDPEYTLGGLSPDGTPLAR